MSDLVTTFRKFLDLTGEPSAAAMLTLANAISDGPAAEGLLTIKQAAARLGVGTKKMYELCSTGAVRHKKVGRQIRIAPSDLDHVAEVSDTRPGDPVAALDAFFRDN